MKKQEKSWTNIKPGTLLSEQKKYRKKYNTRRITSELEYEARSKNLNDWEQKVLESLLAAQKQYPQLTNKQWNQFQYWILKRKL